MANWWDIINPTTWFPQPQKPVEPEPLKPIYTPPTIYIAPEGQDYPKLPTGGIKVSEPSLQTQSTWKPPVWKPVPLPTQIPTEQKSKIYAPQPGFMGLLANIRTDTTPTKVPATPTPQVTPVLQNQQQPTPGQFPTPFVANAPKGYVPEPGQEPEMVIPDSPNEALRKALLKQTPAGFGMAPITPMGYFATVYSVGEGIRNIPAWVEGLYTPPKSQAMIPDYQKSFDAYDVNLTAYNKRVAGFNVRAEKPIETQSELDSLIAIKAGLDTDKLALEQERTALNAKRFNVLTQQKIESEIDPLGKINKGVAHSTTEGVMPDLAGMGDFYKSQAEAWNRGRPEGKGLNFRMNPENAGTVAGVIEGLYGHIRNEPVTAVAEYGIGKVAFPVIEYAGSSLIAKAATTTLPGTSKGLWGLGASKIASELVSNPLGITVKTAGRLASTPVAKDIGTIAKSGLFATYGISEAQNILSKPPGPERGKAIGAAAASFGLMGWGATDPMKFEPVKNPYAGKTFFSGRTTKSPLEIQYGVTVAPTKVYLEKAGYKYGGIIRSDVIKPVRNLVKSAKALGNKYEGYSVIDNLINPAKVYPQGGWGSQRGAAFSVSNPRIATKQVSQEIIESLGKTRRVTLDDLISGTNKGLKQGLTESELSGLSEVELSERYLKNYKNSILTAAQKRGVKIDPETLRIAVSEKRFELTRLSPVKRITYLKNELRGGQITSFEPIFSSVSEPISQRGAAGSISNQRLATKQVSQEIIESLGKTKRVTLDDLLSGTNRGIRQGLTENELSGLTETELSARYLKNYKNSILAAAQKRGAKIDPETLRVAISEKRFELTKMAPAKRVNYLKNELRGGQITSFEPIFSEVPGSTIPPKRGAFSVSNQRSATKQVSQEIIESLAKTRRVTFDDLIAGTNRGIRQGLTDSELSGLSESELSARYLRNYKNSILTAAQKRGVKIDPETLRIAISEKKFELTGMSSPKRINYLKNELRGGQITNFEPIFSEYPGLAPSSKGVAFSVSNPRSVMKQTSQEIIESLTKKNRVADYLSKYRETVIKEFKKAGIPVSKNDLVAAQMVELTRINKMPAIEREELIRQTLVIGKASAKKGIPPQKGSIKWLQEKGVLVPVEEISAGRRAEFQEQERLTEYISKYRDMIIAEFKKAGMSFTEADLVRAETVELTRLGKKSIMEQEDLFKEVIRTGGFRPEEPTTVASMTITEKINKLKKSPENVLTPKELRDFNIRKEKLKKPTAAALRKASDATQKNENELFGGSKSGQVLLQKPKTAQIVKPEVKAETKSAVKTETKAATKPKQTQKVQTASAAPSVPIMYNVKDYDAYGTGETINFSNIAEMLAVRGLSNQKSDTKQVLAQISDQTRKQQSLSLVRNEPSFEIKSDIRSLFTQIQSSKVKPVQSQMQVQKQKVGQKQITGQIPVSLLDQTSTVDLASAFAQVLRPIQAQKPIQKSAQKQSPLQKQKPVQKQAPLQKQKPAQKQKPLQKLKPLQLEERKPYLLLLPKKDEQLIRKKARKKEYPSHWEFSSSAEPEDVTEFIFGSGSGLFSGTKKPKSAPAKKKAKGNKYIR